ncbi:hypothetical protein RND71_040542 [Anisodus tanguticus]|uniref:Exportin-7/Ran-binding protein 17 TPR repeats domain-containing protein n=1 Tax=Anisodus tanguticus TaxID=243964 RepID=A0AAE1QST8_9SOLA|nr:hypothetical protein RND71_040542 [Anisodus tanguticus]
MKSPDVYGRHVKAYDEVFGDGLRSTASRYAIGLKILNQLVSEMNQPSPGLPSAQHRRVACSFRDQSLLQVFQISLTSMAQLKNDVTVSENASSSKLQELALALSLKCLSFDFMGTTVDESSDDFSTIQIPSSWKQVLEDQSTVQIFFDYYEINKPNISKEALECLVRLASVRRSLFTNDTSRVKYLAHLMTGTKDIMQTGKGENITDDTQVVDHTDLSAQSLTPKSKATLTHQLNTCLAHHDNYHVFCRLLGRFKVNYQLSELVNVESYGDWICLVAEFTLRSLQSWQVISLITGLENSLWSIYFDSVFVKSDLSFSCDQWASSSVYYLLGLWSRLVSSVPYLKGDTPSLLSEFVPEIVKSFITSRFGSFQGGEVSDVSENPLDNVELLQDQLDCLPYLCRFQESADSQVLTAVETKFAWIVHIIAAIVKTKQLSGYSGESQEIHDAELSARVLRLINVTDSGLRSQRHAEISKERLDLAILVFFQNFRKSYVGDQAIHSSKQLYARLAELLGLHDHILILNVIVGKIATNLKFYGESEEVISQTLNLMLEMASGQVLLSLELIPDALFRTDDVKQALIGLMRDLRGIAMATSSRRTYGFLFDWLYPSHIPLLLKAITVWADTPEFLELHCTSNPKGMENERRVTTPLLKFVAEFVLNKSQRLNFETSSPNGILLFRELSKLIVAYGSKILSQPNHVDMYQLKYKGIWISLTILSRALAGNYVNFGVFEIYGDRALADAFDIAMRMTLSIPLADILAYRKLSGAYFTFLEIMMKNQIQLILNLDSSSFTFIAGSLESGLKVLDANIKSQCASAVDNLATFYFEHITAGESPTTPVALNLAQHLADCPNIFLEIGGSTWVEWLTVEAQGNSGGTSLFCDKKIWICNDCSNDYPTPWNVRIRIGHVFQTVRTQIFKLHKVSNITNIRRLSPAGQQQRLSLCFDKLMADITRSLDQKNRDKFSNNLTRFRNEFRTR